MFFSAVAHLIGIVAFSAAVLLTMLVLRNPFSPGWLKSEGIAQGAGLVLTACLCVAVGYAGDALIAAHIHYLLAVALIVAVLVGSSYGMWKLFAVGARLKRADEGLSPFAGERHGQLAPTPAT